MTGRPLDSCALGIVPDWPLPPRAASRVPIACAVREFAQLPQTDRPRHMCKGPNTRLTIVALVAALLASSFASATRAALLPAPSDPAADKSTAAAALAIPARDIPARADADERYARDVAAHAQQTKMYDTQRADLDALAANVSQVAMRWHAED